MFVVGIIASEYFVGLSLAAYLIHRALGPPSRIDRRAYDSLEQLAKERSNPITRENYRRRLYAWRGNVYSITDSLLDLCCAAISRFFRWDVDAALVANADRVSTIAHKINSDTGRYWAAWDRDEYLEARRAASRLPRYVIGHFPNADVERVTEIYKAARATLKHRPIEALVTAAKARRHFIAWYCGITQGKFDPPMNDIRTGTESEAVAELFANLNERHGCDFQPSDLLWMVTRNPEQLVNLDKMGCTVFEKGEYDHLVRVNRFLRRAAQKVGWFYPPWDKARRMPIRSKHDADLEYVTCNHYIEDIVPLFDLADTRKKRVELWRAGGLGDAIDDGLDILFGRHNDVELEVQQLIQRHLLVKETMWGLKVARIRTVSKNGLFATVDRVDGCLTDYPHESVKIKEAVQRLVQSWADTKEMPKQPVIERLGYRGEELVLTNFIGVEEYDEAQVALFIMNIPAALRPELPTSP